MIYIWLHRWTDIELKRDIAMLHNPEFNAKDVDHLPVHTCIYHLPVYACIYCTIYLYIPVYAFLYCVSYMMYLFALVFTSF